MNVNARFGTALLLAFSIGLGCMSSANAAPGDLNSTNTGQVIKGGIYYNTPGARTTFQNPGGGLHLKSGQLVRGLEANSSKTVTGHGGTLYFRAPGHVVRFDGNIDVSAVKNKTVYLGNGGKVFVDSAYLYQSGSIYANGVNGGLVQFNVGAATMAPGAKIMAQGFGGHGGTVSINSPGTVDIRRGALIDTSGKVIGTYDTNVINIVGGVVNNEGILRANGIAVDVNPSPLDAQIVQSNPHLLANHVEPVSPGEGTGAILFGPPLAFTAPPPSASRGGTIRLVATGQSFDVSDVILFADRTLVSSREKLSWLLREHLIKASDGDIINSGNLLTQGGYGQAGGAILLSAADDIVNSGWIAANGKDGGVIALLARDSLVNKGTIEALGSTSPYGQGGLLAFSYNTLHNYGKIRANGHDGGLIVFSGPYNPKNSGIVQAYGSPGGQGGTVVLPFLNGIPSGVTSQAIIAGQKNQLLLHGETAILLSQTPGAGVTTDSFLGRLSDAVIRTVDNPLGLITDPVAVLENKANMLIASSAPGLLNLDFDNANINPIFHNLNALMVNNNGDVTNSMHWSPGIHLVGPGSHDTTFSLGGGHISILSAGSITNNGFLLTRGLWSGGNINMAAGANLTNNRVISTIAFNKDLASAFASKPGYFSSHAGGITLKAGGDITNNYRINSPLAFYDIHPPLNNPDLVWPTFLSGAQIGATNYLLAKGNITNSDSAHLSADALTYRNDDFGPVDPANTIGGIIVLKAGGTITNNGTISANGTAYQGFVDPGANDSPKFVVGTPYTDLNPADHTDGDIIVK